MSAVAARRWNVERPDISPSDYLIGATLGWWHGDDESLADATVTVVAQVLAQAGLPYDDAVDRAVDMVFPEGDAERTLGISVQRDGDSYKVRIDFDKDSAH